jgi:hypothetical protein
VRINDDDYRDAGLAGFCRVQGRLRELYGRHPLAVVVDGGGTLERVTLPYEHYGG